MLLSNKQGGNGMFQDHKIFIGKAKQKNVYIYPKMANRPVRLEQGKLLH